MSKPPSSVAAKRLRVAIISAVLALPTLTLVPLGGIWLWQHGFVIYWALFACVVTGGGYWLLAWLIGSPRAGLDASEQATDPKAASLPLPPREKAAIAAVSDIAAKTDPAEIDSRDKLLALGVRTVEAVAQQMHAGHADPIWQFTVPEAMALVEQVSGRMRVFVAESIPLGDRLTVNQVRWLYNRRGIVETASKAYDVWRLVRGINPVSAATQEVREQMTRRIFAWGKDRLARQLVETYVNEVGRAAIDLYSGRLRVNAHAMSTYVGGESRQDLATVAERRAEPLRILVGGQGSVGKSSLINALIGEVRAAVDVLPATADFTPYQVSNDGISEALLLDSPGIVNDEAARKRFIETGADSDFVIWVCAANRADREVDRATLAALRKHFAEHTDRVAPALILVLSHVDRLRPFTEWHPPYDIADATGEKARTIRAAMEAAAADLGFPLEAVVPACLSPVPGLYNVDTIWARIFTLLPAARQAQLVRILRGSVRGTDWARLFSQAGNAGRVLARIVVSGNAKSSAERR